jgi:protein SCO1/2
MHQRILRLMSVLRRSAPHLPVLCLVGALGAAAPTPDAVAGADVLRVSTAVYRVPDVKLVRQDGTAVSLEQEMNDGRPVVLNFIFTSCEAICPLMTHILAEFQRQLGAESSHVHLMSISIDPEQDTPARLREYAKRFHAAPGWTFYTGNGAASVAAQKAFNVFRGEKMDHTAVTLLRAAPGASWQRLDGFATPDDLIKQYRALVAAK